MIEDKDRKSFKARGLVGGVNRVRGVVSWTASEQNRDDRVGITRNAPLEVVVASSYVSKGWARNWNVYQRSQGPVFLKAAHQQVVGQVSVQVDGRKGLSEVKDEGEAHERGRKRPAKRLREEGGQGEEQNKGREPTLLRLGRGQKGGEVQKIEDGEKRTRC